MRLFVFLIAATLLCSNVDAAKPKACPKCKTCPKPKACKVCPKCKTGSSLTCANFASSPCKAYNSRTIDSANIPAQGSYKGSSSSNAPTGARLSGLPQSVILPGNLAAYAIAVAADSGNTYSVATGYTLSTSGCKITAVSPSIFNNALVLDVNYDCSGKYLVAP